MDARTSSGLGGLLCRHRQRSWTRSSGDRSQISSPLGIILLASQVPTALILDYQTRGLQSRSRSPSLVEASSGRSKSRVRWIRGAGSGLAPRLPVVRRLSSALPPITNPAVIVLPRFVSPEFHLPFHWAVTYSVNISCKCGLRPRWTRGRVNKNQRV